MTMGIGSTKRMISVAMLATAVAIKSDALLIHVPSVIEGSQLLAMGLQAKIRLKNMPMVYPTIMKMVTQLASLNHRSGDRRR